MDAVECLAILILSIAFGSLSWIVYQDHHSAAERRMTYATQLNEDYPRYGSHFKIITSDGYVSPEELKWYKDIILAKEIKESK